MGVLIRCVSGACVVLLESIERKGGAYCEMWASLGGAESGLVASCPGLLPGKNERPVITARLGE